ncbi:MAG: response regulator [Planctomycetaceae bacterium]|nr:response regulator [Planctomycetaceae bacterium]
MESDRTDSTILLADDDDDFCVLARKAMERASFDVALKTVENGDELLKFLRKEPPYEGARTPRMILLDLNMPRKDGRAALHDIRADQSVRFIPVIVLTTSRAAKDVLASYKNGASAYIPKPDSFGNLVNVMRSIKQFWFETALLPDAGI